LHVCQQIENEKLARTGKSGAFWGFDIKMKRERDVGRAQDVA
jgi:hypothetical protein